MRLTRKRLSGGHAALTHGWRGRGERQLTCEAAEAWYAWGHAGLTRTAVCIVISYRAPSPDFLALSQRREDLELQGCWLSFWRHVWTNRAAALHNELNNMHCTAASPAGAGYACMLDSLHVLPANSLPQAPPRHQLQQRAPGDPVMGRYSLLRLSSARSRFSASRTTRNTSGLPSSVRYAPTPTLTCQKVRADHAMPALGHAATPGQ
jgi:hypothetical protein